MTSTRIAAAFAAGGLALGILAGSAGTIIIRDAVTPSAVDLTAHMSQMGSMMSMMSMMNGSGGMMNGQDGTAPAASTMPDWMQSHHITISPAPAR